jgi:hypothetical protein
MLPLDLIRAEVLPYLDWRSQYRYCVVCRLDALVDRLELASTGAIQGLVGLLTRTSRLQSLVVRGVVSEALGRTVASHCPSLVRLRAVDVDVGRFRHLRHVELRQARSATDAAIAALAERCPGLETVHVPSARCVTSIAPLLRRCTALTSLDVSGCIALRSLDGVAELPLRHLVATNCMELSRLVAPRTLRRLDVENCGTLDLTIGPSITDLSVAWCRVDVDLALPSLTRLDTAGCGTMTDAGVEALGKRCTALTSLNVSFASALTDLGTLHALTSLDVGGCTALTDAAIATVAKRCPTLAHLDVWYCGRLTDASLTLVARPTLTYLNVSECAVTDALVDAVSERCPSLRRLDAWGCAALTDASIVKLAKRCPALHHLDLSHCASLTMAAVAAVRHVPVLYSGTALDLRDGV